MSERQTEPPMDHDTKPETSSGQSWIYPSLIQAVRPVASLAAKLRLLPYSYNTIYDRDFVNTQYNEEENKKLADIWKRTEDDSVGFVTLHILTRDDDETKVSQLGMSKWRSDGLSQIVSFHGQVEQDLAAVKESALPRWVVGDFIFGETEAIAQSDVGPWLYHTFKSFQNSQRTTCLVGHDIRRILHLVKSDWQVPSDVAIIDTRAIWEFQTEATQHPSLQQTLEGVAGLRGDDSILKNSGNDARFILKLLRIQAKQSRKKAYPLEAASEATGGYRRSFLQHGQVTPASWSSL